MYMYTYFVLTLNFVHVQQHAQPQIAGVGHPCYDRSLLLQIVPGKTYKYSESVSRYSEPVSRGHLNIA